MNTQVRDHTSDDRKCEVGLNFVEFGFSTKLIDSFSEPFFRNLCADPDTFATIATRATHIQTNLRKLEAILQFLEKYVATQLRRLIRQRTSKPEELRAQVKLLEEMTDL